MVRNPGFARRLAEQRSSNLRQLLLRAYRKIDKLVAKELVSRGWTDVRVIHGTLLANLDDDGNNLSELAERARMTKQAMGTLASELEDKGYLERRVDIIDARARKISLTKRGRRLMLETRDIVAGIEAQCAAELGASTLQALRDGLGAFVGTSEPSRA